MKCFSSFYLLVLIGTVSCRKAPPESARLALPDLKSTTEQSTPTANHTKQTKDHIASKVAKRQEAEFFRCSVNSNSVLRYNALTSAPEYCKDGLWTQMPEKETLTEKQLRKKKHNVAKHKRKRKRQHTPRRQRTEDPLAFRCQRSKQFKDSFICQKSLSAPADPEALP